MHLSVSAVAGLKGHILAEQLQGSMRVAILSLKPAKLAGMASEAMLLAADAPQESGAELVRLLIPPGMWRLLVSQCFCASSRGICLTSALLPSGLE